MFIHGLKGKGLTFQLDEAGCYEMWYPEVKNLPQMPCGEPQEMAGSSPAGVAVCWHSALAVAPGLTCCRRKISAAPSSSPGALMRCWIGGPSKSVILNKQTKQQ